MPVCSHVLTSLRTEDAPFNMCDVGTALPDALPNGKDSFQVFR